MDTLANPLIGFATDGSRWQQLANQISGTVITPQDPQYDTARRGFNLAVDQHPAVIVAAHTAADVQTAVQFAAEAGLGISVQSTGHGIISMADENMLILTSPMTAVRVNGAAQTAWVEAGAKWGMVLQATQPFGLAPLLGSSPDVGVVGYTLGGGFGWLGRKYGLSADSVNYFEVVTVDGRLLRVSATENSDLFWGMRGGGGGLGIVTGMEIRLYPVTTVYGGNLFYPVDMAHEVMARFREWTAVAPDELTSSVLIMNFPPIPDMPEVIRGKSFVMVRGCYCGPADEGEALLRFWRDWRAPLLDDFKTMPFSAVATISNDPVDPLPGLSSGAWLRELHDDVIDTIIDRAAPHNGPSPLIFAEVRHAGGAIARMDAAANAYGHRQETLLLQLVGVTPTPEVHEALSQFVNEFKLALQPWLAGVYMNFLEGGESRQRVQEAYPVEKYSRLMQLKAQYDPENRLRSGFNIPPAR
ncbi:MAG: FAD-binding oxidoreductase [Ardenticatenaceae bacterium]|nr:FAD-binding oxidoreductase [Ardenticatenaceae bacterium]